MDNVELPHMIELDRCMQEVQQNIINENKALNEKHHRISPEIEMIRNDQLDQYRRIHHPAERRKTQRRIKLHRRQANRHVLAAHHIVDTGGSKKAHGIHMAFAKLHRSIADAIEKTGRNPHSKKALALSHRMLGHDRGE